MGKLSEMMKGITEKWKSLSRTSKIALGVFVVVVITALTFLFISLSSVKYAVLFSNLDPNDSKTVVDNLKQLKVSNYKISGNSIMVPTSQVDELRLELAPQITDGSKGWELFDSGSTFGSTDTETQIKYQRALQGELEKTIKSFPQVAGTRVQLVLPEDSVFVKDSTPASASVTLMMKAGQTLSDDQVKAIVSLVSGSVRNLPKKNVQIVDDKMKLLTNGIFDDSNTDVSVATEKQQDMKKNYEKYLEDKVMSMLNLAYKDKVSVKVNADLDFDAKKTTSTTYDPKGAVVSEQKKADYNSSGNTVPSQSPVDNNMVNSSSSTTTTTNGNIVHSEDTVNYDNSKTDSEVISAPGAVKKLTASVIIDGNLDNATRSAIQNTVAAAIGIDQTRGDSISIEGIPFDTTVKDDAKKALDAIQKETQQENQMKLYRMIALGVGALIAVIVAVVLFRKKRNNDDEDIEFEELSNGNGIDVVIGNKPEEQIEFKPIDFDREANNERTHIEKEIKKYATEKPDQVIDIIKSWLAEDER